MGNEAACELDPIRDPERKVPAHRMNELQTQRLVTIGVTKDESHPIHKKGDDPMSTEDNKAIAMRTVDAINSGDMSRFESLLAPDVIEHAAPPGMPPTRETTMQFISMLRNA